MSDAGFSAGRLLALYDRIGEAPDAVARLRRFVLDLAVRGKLVEQDPADEPATELLKRIAAEKARLVKAGEIKLRKVKARDREDPLVFPLPYGWAMTDLGSVAFKITDGAHKTPNYVESGVPFVSVKDFSGGTLDLSSTRFITGAEHKVLYQRCDPRRGDILLGRIGTLGKAVLVDTDVEFSLFVSVGMIRFDPDNIDAYFLRLLLNSPFVEAEFDRIKIGGGTHTNKLNLGDLHTVALPLPPLAEQHRIVAKVDELMGLCDRLEEERTRREALRDRLTAASLARLTAPDADGEAFKSHAHFTLDNLPALTARHGQIKTLRQTILNLAVRGKLVEQDTADEPALELLKQIKKRRQELAAAHGVRKKKPIEPLADEDALNLPFGWSADAFANLINPTATISYGVLVPGPDVDDGIPFVRAQDLMLTDHPEKPSKTIAPEVEASYARTRLVGGEILLCVVGSIGKIGVAPMHWAGANIARAVARISPVDLVDRNYLLVFLRSDRAQGYFAEATRTLAQPTLNVGLIEKLPVPLPPLAEQRCIVKKVDELMALCDRLETTLTTTDTTRRRLLEALLHDALAPAASTQEAAE
ncbi:restriction endonuclease subunit S [Pelagibius marinus]|uniref:restriction endonuclease subunit S n=1 Tax=Pelagibius marinus TaxID=2762760 RepID=UPI0018721965|nr:restriction endonuclease subunit S [Pelagibius marinus]